MKFCFLGGNIFEVFMKTNFILMVSRLYYLSDANFRVSRHFDFGNCYTPVSDTYLRNIIKLWEKVKGQHSNKNKTNSFGFPNK